MELFHVKSFICLFLFFYRTPIQKQKDEILRKLNQKVNHMGYISGWDVFNQNLLIFFSLWKHYCNIVILIDWYT